MMPELIPDLGADPGWRPVAGSAVRMSGWPRPRACLTAVRLLCDPDATPRDLLAEVRSPLQHERQDEPGEGREQAIAEAFRLAAEAQAARAAGDAR